MKEITAHCLVKNEARFVWFSVMSVINHVDRVLLWDTGSTDGTKELIKLIERSSDKVQTRFLKGVTPEEFTEVRQKMLDETETDWFIIVDGDEVWWEKSIKIVAETIRNEGDKLESLISPYYNMVGDIYHYQEQAAGKYKIDSKKGHFNIRATKKLSGLFFGKPHGQLGLFDAKGVLIQNRDKKFRKFLIFPYMHFTNVPRASSREKDISVPKRAKKLKYDLGISFPRDFYYPEVFFRQRPRIVQNSWENRQPNYVLKAALQTPLKKIKRRLILDKVGY